MEKKMIKTMLLILIITILLGGIISVTNLSIEYSDSIEHILGTQIQKRKQLNDYYKVELPHYAEISNLSIYSISESTNILAEVVIPQDKKGDFISDLDLAGDGDVESILKRYQRISRKIEWFSLKSQNMNSIYLEYNNGTTFVFFSPENGYITIYILK